jgi:mono/diheme cytochrome c family protein
VSGAGRRRLALAAAAVVSAGIVAVLAVLALNRLDEAGAPEPREALSAATREARIARGAYLARAGDCAACHTVAGGVPYAGGLGVPTPFGTVYAPNLTPDPATGIGQWSDDDFWRALHNGRSRDGRLLYPAFPYPNYTRITRDDSDAIHAYLQSLPAEAQSNRPHVLGFPFDTQVALAVWRALYFRPGVHLDDPTRPAAWNRGAYLVEGLGHCNACHSARNALGGPKALDLAGGMIPVQHWYAPSLRSPAEAGVAHWPAQEVVDLLKTGRSAQALVQGPMAEVVIGSTQYLNDADLYAITGYLQSLPGSTPLAQEPAGGASANAAHDPAGASATSAAGPAGYAADPAAKLYTRHCADCHGSDGRGVPGVYPALAGNRAVLLPTAANLAHVVLEGGFPPSTAGNPRPYGMPPFATVLSDAEVAQLLSYLRNQWGNHAAPVDGDEVRRARGGRSMH